MTDDCLEDGCDQPAHTRGLCKRHYKPPTQRQALADIAEDIVFMLDTGETPAGAARRAGYSDVETMRRSLRRAGYHQVAQRLKDTAT